MHFKAGRSLHIYYSTILLITILAFGGGVKYFWDNGPFNVENLNSAFESSLHFDELKKKSSLESVLKLVNRDRSRDAILRLNTFDKRTRSLDSAVDVPSYENFSNALKQTKKHLNELISYPTMNSVVLVLANKISSFESYVVQNNWRTLTRISSRVKARMSGRAVQTPGFFTQNKISRMVKDTTDDIRLMERVTTGSVLSERDKQNILTKLKTLDTELSMLERYTNTLENFLGSFKTLKNRYDVWFKEIAPQITLTKIEMEKDTRSLAYGLLGMAAFLLASFVFGLWLYGRAKLRSQERSQIQILKYIQDGLFPIESKIHEKPFDEDFQREFERCREYFHKRISFGTVFQEAVPFSSLLLDSNLNLSWANDLFYEHWNLGETHREGSSISWDYLQQYTNLGEDDPVLMAHNQGIAGIYQIQVRNPKTNEVLPYEMYVSPVEYSGQKRIMIFFYPLRGLEETLSHQTRSIVGPIRKTLDAFISNTFDTTFKEKMMKDFEIAGIGELFEKFNEYHDINEQIRQNFLEEIQNLENALSDQMKLISDLEAFNLRKENLSNSIKEGFESSKSAIIHNIDLRYELEALYNSTLNLSQSLLKQKRQLLGAHQESQEILKENFKAFETVNKTKEEFKTLRDSMEELRARLNQSLEQTMLFAKREGNDPRLEANINKIRMEMKGVEQVLQGFGQVLRQLDVGLSKMAMIIEKAEQPDLKEVSNKLEGAKSDLDSFTFDFGRISRSGQKTDELVVESLKGLYDSFGLISKIDKNSLSLVEQYRAEEEEKEVIFTESEELQEHIENNLSEENGQENSLS